MTQKKTDKRQDAKLFKNKKDEMQSQNNRMCLYPGLKQLLLNSIAISKNPDWIWCVEHVTAVKYIHDLISKINYNLYHGDLFKITQCLFCTPPNWKTLTTICFTPWFDPTFIRVCYFRCKNFEWRKQSPNSLSSRAAKVDQVPFSKLSA